MIAKPEPIARVKRRRLRVESKVAQQVRAACVERDGDCRLGDPLLWPSFGPCSGDSEWSHLEDQRRFKTRGMAPQDRHATTGSLQLCTSHHGRYDGRARPRILIQAASSRGADGPLAFACGAAFYLEPEKERHAETV